MNRRMMRRMQHTLPLAAVALLLFVTGCATTGSGSESDYEYEYQIVRSLDVDADADAIYDRMLTWMAERFVSSQDAIQVRDPEERRIVANAQMDMPIGTFGANLPVEMTIITEARDGRFRFTARNLVMTPSAGTVEIREPLPERREDEADAEFDILAQEMATYIEEEQASENDDW